MLNYNADLDLFRSLINIIESEINRTNLMENKVSTIQEKLDFIAIQFQEFKYLLQGIEGEVAEVRINNMENKV